MLASVLVLQKNIPFPYFANGNGGLLAQRVALTVKRSVDQDPVVSGDQADSLDPQSSGKLQKGFRGFLSGGFGFRRGISGRNALCFLNSLGNRFQNRSNHVGG